MTLRLRAPALFRAGLAEFGARLVAWMVATVVAGVAAATVAIIWLLGWS